MAKTFNDFVVECQAYPYSAENFNLMKECSELDLTAHFLESQAFIQDNHDMLFGEGVEISTGYMTESVDDNTIEVMTEKFEIRAGEIMSRMKTAIKNLIKTLRNLFMRLAPRFDENSKIAAEIIKKMGTIKSERDALDNKDIITTIQSIKIPHDKMFIVPGQPDAKKFKNTTFGGDSNLCDKLAVGLGVNTVTLKAPGKGAAAIDIRDLKQIIQGFERAKDSKGIKNVATLMINTINDSTTNGVSIPTRPGYLASAAKELDAIMEELDKDSNVVGAEIKSTVKASNDSIKEKNKAAGATGGAVNKGTWPEMNVQRDVVAKLTKSAGDTAALYMALNTFRNDMVSALKKIIKPDAPAAKDSNSGDEGDKNTSKE